MMRSRMSCLAAVRIALLGSVFRDPLSTDRANFLFLATAFTTEPGPKADREREKRSDGDSDDPPHTGIVTY
jgi:hypothetical protein